MDCGWKRTAAPSLLVAALFTLAALFTGCATKTDLTPLPGPETTVIAGETARSVVRGVRVIVQSDAWTGEGSIPRAVTPLRVTVENGSERPLRIGYDHLRLVGSGGRLHAVLSPFEAISELEAPAPPPPVADPLMFQHSGFRVAPHFAYLVPGPVSVEQGARLLATPRFRHPPGFRYYGSVEPDGAFPHNRAFDEPGALPGPFHPHGSAFRHPLGFNQLYYDQDYRYWEDTQVAMDQVRRRGVPEGVLEPGGKVGGFFYFEKVSPDQARVELRFDLIDADTGEPLGELRVPFAVQEG